MMLSQSVFFAQISLSDWPSPGGLPFLPSLALTGALLAGLAALVWRKSPAGYESKIQRTVNGDFRDPDSTRDLSGIAPDELELMRTACTSGLKEAEGLALMSDAMFLLAVRNADSVSHRYGLPGMNLESASLEDLRGYFEVRWEHLVSLQGKLDDAVEIDGLFAVAELSPGEYEHLVSSLQAEYRTAVVYSQMSTAQAKKGCEFVDQVFVDLGLDAWGMYGEWREDLPGWMASRVPVIEGVLGAVNVAYEGVKYPE